jgi:hypothetical protein|nr:MAG TPA: hypothetical protein [Caudoviricetes sp.]
MTTCEQLERAVRDFIKECQSHTIGDPESCKKCFYSDFCHRFYPKGDDMFDWWIEDKETN